MTTWLKLVGAVDAPMPDPWLTERADLRSEVGFGSRANVEIGEELVLYAIPQRKIIGLAEVVSHPIRSSKEERWPWRSKVRLKLAIVDFGRCPGLDDLAAPGGRDLRKAVQRRGHLALEWAELIRARDALRVAVDLSKGDLLDE
jgi:hypothetical protein